METTIYVPVKEMWDENTKEKEEVIVRWEFWNGKEFFQQKCEKSQKTYKAVKYKNYR